MKTMSENQKKNYVKELTLMSPTAMNPYKNYVVELVKPDKTSILRVVRKDHRGMFVMVRYNIATTNSVWKQVKPFLQPKKMREATTQDLMLIVPTEC